MTERETRMKDLWEKTKAVRKYIEGNDIENKALVFREPLKTDSNFKRLLERFEEEVKDLKKAIRKARKSI